MVKSALRSVRLAVRDLRLPRAARNERTLDSLGLPAEDPGIDLAVDEGIAWLGRAQDRSASADGGVARHYSLITGWASSYPETTGYIIPTMLAYASLRGDESVRQRAKRMLDWLVSIQLPCGGFQSGSIGATAAVPVTFNTGQILLGLAAGVREFGQYREELCHAANWLVETQDPDGCWRKHPSPLAAPGEKAYETHVAWGLLEAVRVQPNESFIHAALANVRWALSQQRDNGWFDKCCLLDSSKPLTHTLGYALRGIVEAYRFTGDQFFLQAAKKTANGLLTPLLKYGFIPGCLRSDWTGAVDWACLTGAAQIAHCWLMLYQDTQDSRYRNAAYATNAYLRRTIKTDGPPETRGAVKGSFPISGEYGTYQYLNWACKFTADANMLERELRAHEKQPRAEREERI